MYYNIKIKSKGSEFILESNNKSVTQREMDIYFAYIFDVSDEFKSKIKKIEIIDENVKSIEEIENIQPDTQTIKSVQKINTQNIDIQNIQTPDIPQQTLKQENIQSNIEKNIKQNPQPEIQELVEQVVQPASFEQNINIAPNNNVSSIQEKTYELPKETQVLEVQPEIINQTPIVDIIENKPIQITEEQKEEIEALPPDININPEELIKFQQLQESEPIIQEFAQYKQTFEDKNSGLIFEDIKEEINTDSSGELSEIDEIINMAKSELKTIDISQNKEFDKNLMDIVSDKKTPQHTQHLNQLYSHQDIPTIEFDTAGFNQSNAQNVSHIDFETIDVTNVEIQNKYAKLQENKNQQIFNSGNAQQVAPQQTNPTQNPTDTTQELSLSAFMKSLKNINLITDEFLICAFYMKNFLNQEFFTIKQINSKLFQTTGKIASTSVADELINKGFLKVTHEVDAKKYCITTDGENYFATTYQG